MRDVPTFGKKGAFVPVSVGLMRNEWFPRRTANYVTPASLKTLKAQNVDLERDYTYKADEVARKGRKTGEVDVADELAALRQSSGAQMTGRDRQRQVDVERITVGHTGFAFTLAIMYSRTSLIKPTARARRRTARNSHTNSTRLLQTSHRADSSSSPVSGLYPPRRRRTQTRAVPTTRATTADNFKRCIRPAGGADQRAKAARARQSRGACWTATDLRQRKQRRRGGGNADPPGGERGGIADRIRRRRRPVRQRQGRAGQGRRDGQGEADGRLHGRGQVTGIGKGRDEGYTGFASGRRSGRISTSLTMVDIVVLGYANPVPARRRSIRTSPQCIFARKGLSV